MGYIKVKNVNGSSRWDAPEGYASWIDYWCKHKGLIIDCCATDCNGEAEVGAHVVKAEGDDKSVYIVPLCKGCNKRTDEFMVHENLLLPVPSRL